MERTNDVNMCVCKNINQSEPEGQSPVQSNEKFSSLAASRPGVTASRLSRSSFMQRKIKENLWDQCTFAHVRVVHSLLQIRTLCDSAQ